APAAKVASNAQAKSLAVRYISFGDTQFADQQYHSAAQRYRFAIEAAPDVADAHFRQGFAYIASNRYDFALKSFRKALELEPLFVNSSFRLDDLYGANRLAKGSHIDALARSALIDRGNPDHYFLIGLMLHFDGQRERAVRFFEKAESLAGEDASHIQAFLVPAAPSVDDSI
ncbi:MAG: tetratricopeptide repeat protein, partial [Planctomycetales bacterium]|nr:tetratricopeptide repeat protein [Planctomycetales bacterium]